MKNLRVGEILISKMSLAPVFIHRVNNDRVVLIACGGKISLPLQVVKEEYKKASKKDIIFFISDDIKWHLYNHQSLKIYDSLDKLRIEFEKLTRDWYKDL